MSNKYTEYKGLNLPEIEKKILEIWQQEDSFNQSILIRKNATPFVFYEGPPSANGMPGIHHVISKTIKDMICRYKTMQGFLVQRKGGWDTHGLPVELGVEKELGITKDDIGKKISIEEYNKKCKEAVLRYKDKWDEITIKMGHWVNLKNPYITFENNYIESLWWILQQFYSNGLLYQSLSIQPYSPAAGTGLSSHELNQPGCYKMVKDTSAVVMFEIIENTQSKRIFLNVLNKNIKTSFLAWTTTPWTLPSNLALAVSPNIDYVLVETYNPYSYKKCNVILAKKLFDTFFLRNETQSIAIGSSVKIINGDLAEITNLEDQKQLLHKGKLQEWKILDEFKGKDFENIQYKQLLPFEANKDISLNACKVLLGDFVTTEDGTGIVHIAPAFGADDYKIGQKYNIGILNLVDKEGKFIDGVGEFSSRYVKDYKNEENYKDVNIDICVKLKHDNKAFKVEKYEHNYPHCWRTDKPILYYPLNAWFIKTTAKKARLIELNKTINWKPKSTGEGRFGNWLENMVDWNLSRSRFWGTPLPIWRTEDEKEEICIGSVQQLTTEYEKAIAHGFNMHKKINIKDGKLDIDLHKPFVDDIELVSPTGKKMNRVSDLIDVWFDSGAMPFAQWHYPFENKNDMDLKYPADFIAEGVDQTRGWFYTLHTISVLLNDKIAYKNVMSNGLVLDKNGNKMSKRLGNVINPFETIEKFGADATRWYLITNASPWDNLKFDLSGIQEVQRKFFGTFYNTYQFFAMYANVDSFTYSDNIIPVNNRPEMDRWIISVLNTLIKKVTDFMDDYEPTNAFRLVEFFLNEQLSNWYVRLNRRRFWKGEFEFDKICAYQTLYECLINISKLIAPISPFFSDTIYRNLQKNTHNVHQSVHCANYPISDDTIIDNNLEDKMKLAQEICNIGLSLRKKENIKVRQPLQKILIPILKKEDKALIESMQQILLTELNIKEITFLDEHDNIIVKQAKPNFKTLGSRAGSKMKQIQLAISQLSTQQINDFEQSGHIEIKLDNETFLLNIMDIEIVTKDIEGLSIASKNNITVALDLEISESLFHEGIAREFINKVQNIRKELLFNITDKIKVQIYDNYSIKKSILQFSNYICNEILAEEIDFVPKISNGSIVEINEEKLVVILTKL